ncbi:MAG: hypothetical protein NT091_04095 [Candidatus Falkowbacteria bacterium]|nr:hypothetical protein [Candidatus Falkowbacteria bacterium]
MPKLTAVFVRVGSAHYLQENTSIKEANDLNLLGEQQMEDAAWAITKNTEPFDKIRIFSSLSGRALHASKIIYGMMNEHSFFNKRMLNGKPYEPENIIKRKPALNEVLNFDPITFRWLLHGSREAIEGEIVEGDRGQTNPENLNQLDYINHRYWEHVDLSVLPEKARKKLLAIESDGSLQTRVTELIIWLKNQSQQGVANKFYILVTHLAIAKIVSGKYIPPGGIYKMEINL